MHPFSFLSRQGEHMTRQEAAFKLRRLDLLRLTKAEIDGACQTLGISARGERVELIERIYREIWRSVYDTQEDSPMQCVFYLRLDRTIVLDGWPVDAIGPFDTLAQACQYAANKMPDTAETVNVSVVASTMYRP